MNGYNQLIVVITYCNVTEEMRSRYNFLLMNNYFDILPESYAISYQKEHQKFSLLLEILINL